MQEDTALVQLLLCLAGGCVLSFVIWKKEMMEMWMATQLNRMNQ